MSSVMTLKSYGPQKFGKMGARTMMWHNPYVTDGLVAWWDGIWNAGLGVHDPNATVWKDLIGGLDFTIPTGATIESDSIIFGLFQKTNILTSEIAKSSLTLELIVHAERNGGSIGNTVFSFGSKINFRYGNDSFGVIEVNCPEQILQDATIDARRLTYVKTYPFNRRNSHVAINEVGQLRQFWFNGELQAYVFRDGVTHNYNDTEVFLGQTYYSNGVMEICCARAYSRALTASEIAHNYAVDKARFNLP